MQMQTLWDHPTKIPYCAKVQRNLRYARSLGEKTPFSEAWGGTLKKVLIAAATAACAKVPNAFRTLWDHPKNNSFCAKVFKEIAICQILREKTPFSGLEFPDPKKLIAALSCMRKGPKCIQTLWDHPKKIPFVQKYKEIAICEILREKTPFWSIPRG